MVIPGRIGVTPQLLDQRIVAVLRAPVADRFLDIANTLVAAGIRCLEFTLTSDGALEALRTFAGQADSSDVDVGAGTVLTTADVDAAADAGATFVVSPVVRHDVIARATDQGLACYPGAMTPTEIFDAWQAGATAVKVFPAQALGGAQYISHLRGPLPQVPLVPTGGIGVEDVASHLAAGALAVGVGGPLLGDAPTSGDFRALRERALDLLSAARSERTAP